MLFEGVIYIKINFIFMTVLLILLTVDPAFAEAQNKKETVKVEIPIEARIVRSFKIEREDMSKPMEVKQAKEEMDVKVLERVDEENNIRTFIFE